MVQIQYASDLHIDGWPVGTSFYTFITPVAPILVLAGDICSAWSPLYKPFLAWCSRNWAYVILITGNHEYYTEDTLKTIQETDKYIWILTQKYKNVIFLQDGASFVIPGTRLRFMGATLWSAIEPGLWDEAASRKGDCRHITISTPRGIKKIHPGDMCALHALHRHALGATMGTIPGERLVVVTHHMPTLDLLEPRYRNGEKWSSFYASNDVDLIGPWVPVWICGHGHRSTTLTKNGTTLYMNARGYNRSSDAGRNTDVYNPRACINFHI